MNKSHRLIIAMLMISFGLVGCGEMGIFEDEYKKNKYHVQLSTSGESYSTSVNEIKFILHNIGEKPVSYSNPYRIQKMEDGEWVNVDFERNFNLPLRILKPDEKVSQTLSRSILNENLEKGKYRIIKEITEVDSNNTLAKLSTSFDVNEL